MPVVRVKVEAWLIEDGQYPFPEIGHRATYVCRFVPCADWMHPEMCADCGMFDADVVGALPADVRLSGTVVGRRIVTVATDPFLPGHPPAPSRISLSDVDLEPDLDVEVVG